MNLFGKARGFCKKNILYVLFLVAIIIKIIFFMRIIQNPSLALSFGDPKEYYEIGLSLVKNQTFSIYNIPNSTRPPGYPLIIVLYIKIFGDSVAPVFLVLANYIFGLLTSYLIYILIIRASKSKAIIGFSLYALNPILALYESALFSEPLFILFLISSIYFLSRQKIILCSIFAAFATYIRPVGTIIFLLIVIFLIIKFIKKPEQMLKPILSVILFLFLLFPWYLRNKIQFGRWFFSNIGEFNIGLYTAPFIYAEKNNLSIRDARVEWLNHIYVDGSFSSKYPPPNLEKAKELSAYWSYLRYPEITHFAQKKAIKLFLSAPKEATVYSIKSMMIAVANPGIYPLILFFSDFHDSALRRSILDNALKFDLSKGVFKNFLFLYKINVFSSLFSIGYSLVIIYVALLFLRKMISKMLFLTWIEWLVLCLFLVNWFISGFAGLGGSRYFIVAYLFMLIFSFIEKEKSAVTTFLYKN